MMAKAESAASKYTFSEMRKWSSRSSVFSVRLGRQLDQQPVVERVDAQEHHDLAEGVEKGRARPLAPAAGP